MLLLAVTLLSAALAWRLRRGPAMPRAAGSPFEQEVLALGEEEEWRAENALRRRYDPPPIGIGLR